MTEQKIVRFARMARHIFTGVFVVSLMALTVVMKSGNSADLAVLFVMMMLLIGLVAVSHSLIAAFEAD